MTIPSHIHGPEGETIALSDPPAAADVEAVEAAGDAEVKVAEVHAERDVELGAQELEATRIRTDAELVELRTRVEELERENATLREQLAPPEPEPVDPGPAELPPAPVEVVEPPAPPPAEPTGPAPEKNKRPRGFFS